MGKLFGDKGYTSQSLQEKLKQKGVELLTKRKSNMKPQALLFLEQLRLRKRALIESINNFLKNTRQMQHTHHKSKPNWLVNLFSALIAYSFLPKKPCCKFNHDVVKLPPV